MAVTKPVNPYDKRKNKIDPRDYPKLNNKSAEKVSEQRQAFWDSLHAYVRNAGGNIVSPPFMSPVRIELPVEKSLVGDKLAQLGYDIVDRGNESRAGGLGFYTARIFELKIPTK